MIIKLKSKASEEEVRELTERLEQMGFSLHFSRGEFSTVIGLIGDTTLIDINKLLAFGIVETVNRISEPFKQVNRKFHGDDTVVTAGASKIGGGFFAVMAGPCSVEEGTMLMQVAKSVKASGATFLRGGAFKPRTSPYAFQGMGEDGIKLLLEAKAQTGLPIVTEIMSESQLKHFDQIDMFQVGARNMQNFGLLKDLGRTDKPVLLKRGLSSTVEELLMSAEYLMAGGNKNIVLCERGIRTFEKYTRNTLDLSAVPVLKRLTHLPVIIDPSHATGHSYLVEPMAKAAAVCGADGFMVEVHSDPKNALSDGSQSLTPNQFDSLMQAVKPLLKIENKIL